VCQTLAYAHSKGVIHRDLKPANIMVGAFGEVQVMDWGLAKRLGEPGVSAPGGAPPEADAPGTPGQTQAGAILGTPAYMAPEQAQGQTEKLDERADVFGLGAILCEVLTGAPPFLGPSTPARLRQAAAGDLDDAFARLSRCGADPALAELARGCLAGRREERPRDAGEVAGRVTAYRAAVQERLRQAELARARAEEERKRRRAQLGLALALLVLVVVGGGAAWAWQQQQQAQAAEALRRRQDADAAVLPAMAQARLLRKEGRLEEALASARHAEQLAQTAEASDDVRREAAQLAEAVGEEIGPARRDRRLLAELLDVPGPHQGPKFQPDEHGRYTALAVPGPDAGFQAAFRRWGLDVDATPTAEAAERLRQRPAAVRAEVIAALDEWASARRLEGSPAPSWQRLTDLAQALDEPDSRRRELRAILARDGLARERALGALSAALTAALARPAAVPFDAGLGDDRGRLRRLAAETDAAAEPVLGVLTLAQALLFAGDEARAERLLRSAILARPQEVVLHQALGHLLIGSSPPRHAEAVECYAAARALRPALAGALAVALVRAGRKDEGLELYQRLVKDDPDNPWLHAFHGYVLRTQGRLREAEAAYREALRLDPRDAASLNNLGMALGDQRRLPEAEETFRRLLQIKADARTYNNLGAILLMQRRFPDAESAFREAVRLQPEGDAFALNNLGLALLGQRRFREAEAPLRQATRRNPNLASAQQNLSMALFNQEKFAEAEPVLREALRLAPDDVGRRYQLAQAIMEQGRFAEALQACRQAEASAGMDPRTLRSFASLTRRIEQLAELDRRLPAFLAGDGRPPKPAELLEFATVCLYRAPRLPRTAARLSAEAFAAEPRLAGDFNKQARYDAVCGAALAAAGRGEDADNLPDKVQALLRRQALQWLRADLQLYANLAARGDPKAKETVRQRLAHWQSDPDLAGVRDNEVLTTLHEAEGKDWQRLWVDVADLLRRAGGNP
jgi:tetratricopeptide (TPR) repeat protein